MAISLSAVVAAPAAAAGYPKASATDLAACRAVAALASAAHNQTRSKRLPLGDWTYSDPAGAFVTSASVRLPDSRRAKLSLNEYGTVHRSDPAIAVDGETRVYDAQVGHKDEEGEPWGLTSRWFLRGGRIYLVHFDSWGAGYPIYVGALGRALDERPICRLRTGVQLRLPPAPHAGPGAAALCRAVLRRQVHPLKVRRFANPAQVADRPLLAGHILRAGELQVDAANTGKPQRLFLFEGDSMAAGGCHLSYFDTASPGDASAAHRGLTAAQGLNHADNAYPRRTCTDATPTWFTYGGRNYLMSRAVGAFNRDPGSERGEFLTVDTLHGGQARRICTSDWSRRAVFMTDVWDGSQWRPVRRARPAARK